MSYRDHYNALSEMLDQRINREFGGSMRSYDGVNWEYGYEDDFLECWDSWERWEHDGDQERQERWECWEDQYRRNPLYAEFTAAQAIAAMRNEHQCHWYWRRVNIKVLKKKFLGGRHSYIWLLQY